jgi:hydrogenase/urease accessory protein HupE
MSLLNTLSLILEIVTAGLGVWLGLMKKKKYGWLIALTFTIYVIYDLSRFLNLELPARELLFLAASISIFCAVWLLAKQP